MATDWERWRRIGATANEDAQTALGQDYGKLLNGWLEYVIPPSTSTEPGYTLDNDKVWLKGQIRSGTMGSAAFRLPPYASPAGPRLMTTVAQQSSGGLIVVALEILPDATGASVIPRGAANVRLALDGGFTIL